MGDATTIQLRRVGHMEAADPPWWCAFHVRQESVLRRDKTALIRCPKGHLFALERDMIDAETGWLNDVRACPTCRWGGVIQLEGWSDTDDD